MAKTKKKAETPAEEPATAAPARSVKRAKSGMTSAEMIDAYDPHKDTGNELLDIHVKLKQEEHAAHQAIIDKANRKAKKKTEE